MSQTDGTPSGYEWTLCFFTIKANSGTQMRFTIKATPLLFTLPPIPFRRPCQGFCFFMGSTWLLTLYRISFTSALSIDVWRFGPKTWYYERLIKLPGNESGGGGEGGNESYNLYKISQLVGGCPIILIRRDRITGEQPILQRAANKFDFLALPLHMPSI